MIKVLILGSNGYLGKVFLKRFNKKIIIKNPTRKELNLYSKKQIDKYFKKKDINFDILLNLCVYQQTGSHLVKNAKKVKELNNLLSKNILYLWQKYLNKSRLISLGASCAYSKYLNGFSYTRGKLFGVTKDFAYSKRIFAKRCQLFHKKFKMKYLILIPGTLIGPGEQLNISKMHFFNGVLYRAALYKNKIRKKFHFIMNRNVLRELSSVDEVCLEIFKRFKTRKIGIENLKPDYRISLEQFYNLVAKRLKIMNKEGYKNTSFKASINKEYKVNVRKDFTNKKTIVDKGFLKIFDSTYKFFSNEIRKKL